MKVYKHNTIISTKEIARKLREVASNVSDRLIHTAHRSVSLVHYTFRNDYENRPATELLVELIEILLRFANKYIDKK